MRDFWLTRRIGWFPPRRTSLAVIAVTVSMIPAACGGGTQPSGEQALDGASGQTSSAETSDSKADAEEATTAPASGGEASVPVTTTAASDPRLSGTAGTAASFKTAGGQDIPRVASLLDLTVDGSQDYPSRSQETLGDGYFIVPKCNTGSLGLLNSDLSQTVRVCNLEGGSWSYELNGPSGNLIESGTANGRWVDVKLNATAPPGDYLAVVDKAGGDTSTTNFQFGPVDQPQIRAVVVDGSPALAVVGFGEDLSLDVYYYDKPGEKPQPRGPAVTIRAVRTVNAGAGVGLYDVKLSSGQEVCVAPTDGVATASNHLHACFGGSVPTECPSGTVETFAGCEDELDITCHQTAGSSIAIGQIFDVEARSAPAAVSVKIVFDHGDGTRVPGAKQQVLYNAAGTYELTFSWEALGQSGVIDCGTIAARVPTSPAPTPIPTTATAPLTIRCSIEPDPPIIHVGDLLRYSPIEDPPTSGVHYRWDHGDGTIDPHRVSNATYSEPGSYQVRLFWDFDGKSGSVDCPVVQVKGEVSSAPVSCSIQPGFLVTVGQPLVFRPVPSRDLGPLLQIRWDHGDGTIDPNDVSNAHYEEAGEYPVKLLWTLEFQSGVVECGTIVVVERS